MMASMAVGGAVAKNIGSVMNSTLNMMNNEDDTPPPIPKLAYHVAKDKKAIGPFDMEKLMEMANSGELTPDSLVWKKGMKDWKKAGEVEDLAEFFHPEI